MIGMTKTVTIGNAEFTARELTVLEVRNWLAAIEKRGLDIVGDVLFDAIAMADIAMICGVETTALDSLTPSQVRIIAEACREVNPDFFAMTARLTKIGELAETQPQAVAKASKAR